MKNLFKVKQPFTFLFIQLFDRYASPAGNNIRNIFLGYYTGVMLIIYLTMMLLFLKLIGNHFFFVTNYVSRFKILRINRCSFFLAKAF